MTARIYTSLREEAAACPAFQAPVERVCIGQVWTLVQVAGLTGLCMSPQSYSRTLGWSGELTGQPASMLIDWLDSWQPFESVLAVATLNAVLSGSETAQRLQRRSEPLGTGNLAVFEALKHRLQGQVSVIGRYPGLNVPLEGIDFHCIERIPGEQDYPDQAAEYLLPESHWAFITASALANKTLPRLLTLSQNSQTVLMGPSMPWSSVWQSVGVELIAGIVVDDADRLWRTVAEAGGVRIFQGGVSYRLLDLHAEQGE